MSELIKLLVVELQDSEPCSAQYEDKSLGISIQCDQSRRNHLPAHHYCSKSTQTGSVTIFGWIRRKISGLFYKGTKWSGSFKSSGFSSPDCSQNFLSIIESEHNPHQLKWDILRSVFGLANDKSSFNWPTGSVCPSCWNDCTFDPVYKSCGHILCSTCSELYYNIGIRPSAIQTGLEVDYRNCFICDPSAVLNK